MIEELLSCNIDLAEAVAKYLKETYWHDVADGGEDNYSPEQRHYQLDLHASQPYLEAFAKLLKQWEQFEWDIKHRNCFLSARQAEFLTKTFAPLLNGELNKGIAPIIVIGTHENEFEFIYRGREASALSDRKRIYANPTLELSPPPPKLRRQGRMNAAGISAFYGCGDVETCVAELRVPVGGAAVVGKFKFLRPTRLLDLRQVKKTEPFGKLSWFSWDFVDKNSYADFVRGLHDLIRRPVLPGDESLEYLPTQMIAEYLSSRADLRLDGIMFSSSLVSKGNAEDENSEGEAWDDTKKGVNIVLFAGSSVVSAVCGNVQYEVTRISEPNFDDETAHWGFTEWVDRKPIKPADDAELEVDFHESYSPEPTLEIVEDEIRVVHVRAIKYVVNESKVEFEPRARHF